MPSGARAASWLLLFSLLGGEPSPVRSTSTALALHCHCRVEHSLRLAGARASVLLFEAASEGDADKLRTLLDKDKYDVNWRGEYGMSSVHIASLNNQAECVRLLISAGAKVNQFDTEGWTPLMAAASFAEHKMVKILLDAGANPTRRIQKGNHKGMNARDLVKDILEQKGSMATKCLGLLEGVPAPRAPPCLVALVFPTWRLPSADGVKTWWANKEAKEARRGGRAADGDADADAEGLGDAVADGSADAKSEL